MAASTVRFESQTVIHRPAAEVFERLADLPGYRHWLHHGGLFRGSDLTSALPVGEGATYVDRTWMGRFEGEVSELVPPVRIAFDETLSWFGRPLTRARPGYVLEGQGDVTTVHHVAVAELYGVMRLLLPVARWLVDRERSRTLRALERSFGTDQRRRQRQNSASDSARSRPWA